MSKKECRDLQSVTEVVAIKDRARDLVKVKLQTRWNPELYRFQRPPLVQNMTLHCTEKA